MEKVSKKISLQNHLKLVEEMSMFGWEVTDCRKDDEYAYIDFQRDPEMENYQEIRKLEDRWFSYKYPPMWPMIALSILAFGLITALLVVFMVFKENFDMKLWLLALGLPAFICITLSTLWFAYRVHKMKKVLDSIDKDRIEIKEKLATLLKEKDNENKE